ncbi:MAG: NrpR regulatory domain-containing protein [Archaeoglobaceae archaeon]
MIEEEILDILAEFGPLSSQEIEKELQSRGFNITSRTVRYHLRKLEKKGFVAKGNYGKTQITVEGIEFLRGSKASERLGEFSERIEINVYTCDFDVYKMRGKVPTNLAIIGKEDFETCHRVLAEMEEFPFIIHRGVFFADEGEDLNDREVPKGHFALATISNTIYDVLLRSKGVNTHPEFAALIGVEKMTPNRILELISYSGTTMSPGWLLLRSGLTSINSVLKTGNGVIISAVRSFSRYAIDIVLRTIEIANSKGFRGVLAILHPSDKRFSLPVGRRARLIVSAGLNHLAPLHEMGIKMDIKVNEIFVEFSKFKPVSNIK